MSKSHPERVIYHGSAFRIERPVYGVGKVHNDFGLGFYCTENLDLAMEWAVSDEHDGYANRYVVDLAGLRILNLAEPPYTTLHWLSVLVRNRVFDMDGGVIRSAASYLWENFPVDEASADVMVGPRADDNYFSFARGFLNGTLSYPQLCRAMRLGGLGLQTVLKSPAAFDRVRPDGFERATRAVSLRTRRNREDAARRAFGEILRTGFRPDELYMVNIIQQGIQSDDPRLSSVVS